MTFEQLPDKLHKLLIAFYQNASSDFYYCHDTIQGWFYEKTLKDLRKEIAVLREYGYVEYRRGLMTEDDEVAGSGNSITPYGEQYCEYFNINDETIYE